MKAPVVLMPRCCVA